LRDFEVRNAVIAHIRHSYTNYGELLWKEGFDKEMARDHIRNELNSILRKWECS